MKINKFFNQNEHLPAASSGVSLKGQVLSSVHPRNKLRGILRQNKILFAVIILASVLRLWNLQNMPPHLRNDEAALGYNAYSVLNTARDEHGEFFPVIFQSFGDWKMGLYVYLTIPFIAILGLTELAVRLPSVVAGVVAVPLLYGLSFELFHKKRVALVSGVLLAISPILMPFSRGAWEVNVSFTLTLGGIFFFLLSLKKNKQLFLLSALFFGLTLICSHGAKFSTPVIIVILILIFFREFKKIPRHFILGSLLIITIFMVPVILSFSQGKVARLTTLSIFSYPGGSGVGNVTYFLSAILSRWLSLYSAKTLFLKGDLNPQHGAPDMGPFLLMDVLFLFLGFIKLIKMGFTKQTLFVWSTVLLLSLPSALTIEKANFERVLVLFIPFFIIASIGVDYIWENIKYSKYFVLCLIISSVLYLINFFYFLDQYFVHGSKKNTAWQFGYKQIVQLVSPVSSEYNQIIVQQSLEQPYIFFLFYGKYNPQKYQKIVSNVFLPNKEGKDMGLVYKLDNIIFRNIDWKTEKPGEGILYIMPEYKLNQLQEFYSSYKTLDEVRDTNGFLLFRLVEII